MDQTFVVTTQFLENYGAHCEDGRFASSNHYWKMKGGYDYAVSGLDRIQDAVAFVAAIAMHNDIGSKEFPIEWKTWAEWEANLPEDQEYREFLMGQVQYMDPRDRSSYERFLAK